MTKFLIEKEEKEGFSFRAKRYRVERRLCPISVDISRGNIRQGSAELLEISSSGLAFRTFVDLVPGMECTLGIEFVGTFQAQIVRRFNVYSFGARFLMDQVIANRLQRQLEEMVL